LGKALGSLVPAFFVAAVFVSASLLLLFINLIEKRVKGLEN